MSIVMNETIYIHDDAHDAFMTRPWHTTRSIGQHSYSCRSVHAIGGQARCRHGLAPALFICAVTGASLGACRPGGEAAHRGGWGDRETGIRYVIDPDEDIGFLDIATP